MKVQTNRDPETDDEHDWLLALKLQVLRPHKCLKCNKVFNPRGKFNRICYDCQEVNKDIKIDVPVDTFRQHIKHHDGDC